MGFDFRMESPLVMKEEKEEQEDCKSSYSPTLPGDMIYEILSYVPLDNLLRQCRWVSRDWNALASDPTFKRFHRQKTQSVSGYFVQNLKKNRYHSSFLSIAGSQSLISLDFLPTTDIRIEASSYQAQGLVCCFRRAEYCNTPPRYYVCKPVTQQWTPIPNPKTRYNTEKMSIVVKKSHPLHYKIIRLSCSKNGWGLHCEIFDSKKWAWKMYFDTVKLPYHLLLSLEPEVLLHGSIHWLTFGEEIIQIFAFDMDKENWRLIPLPQSQVSSSSLEGGVDEEVEAMNHDFRIHKKLVNCQGFLSLLYISWTWIEVWIMEDYWKNTWKKKFKVSLEPLNQIVRGYSILAMETMDIILVKTSDELIWYNCTNGVVTQVMEIQNPTIGLGHPFHLINSDNLSCNLGLRK